MDRTRQAVRRRLRSGKVHPTRHRCLTFDPVSKPFHSSDDASARHSRFSPTPAWVPHRYPQQREDDDPGELRHGSRARGIGTDTEHRRTQVVKVHKAAGHPSSRNLARIVKDAGHLPWKVKATLDYRCPTCDSLKKGGYSAGQVPWAATHALYRAWEAVVVDSGEWLVPGRKRKYKFLLFMDVATKLRVIQPLFGYDFLEMKAENAEHLIKGLAERWLGTYPKPKFLLMDSAKSFISEKAHDFASTINVILHFTAEKEPWANGVIEAATQDVKHTATAIQMENLDQDPEVTLYLTVAALNSTEYVAGFTSFQWAFGQSYHLDDEDVRTFAVLPEGHGYDFGRLVTARQQAEEVARSTRAKRALSKLSNTVVRQPLREYSPMDLVKVWRKVWPMELRRGNRGGFKKSGRPHWIGPGRVIFSEILPHQVEGDGRRHILWVLVGSHLLRCSAHSVRPVSETERFVYETSGVEKPSMWKTLADILPKREYVDITDRNLRMMSLNFLKYHLDRTRRRLPQAFDCEPKQRFVLVSMQKDQFVIVYKQKP